MWEWACERARAPRLPSPRGARPPTHFCPPTRPPARPPGLYNYAKALEDAESGLLGGFYYKHFCLAANVIGSEARGTMRRAVAALKRTYEAPLFPQLDAVRWGGGGAGAGMCLCACSDRCMHAQTFRLASAAARPQPHAPQPAPSGPPRHCRRPGRCWVQRWMRSAWRSRAE